MLRDARGLCHRHAWRLAGWRGSTVGAAIVYHDVVNTLAKVLEQQGSCRGSPSQPRLPRQSSESLGRMSRLSSRARGADSVQSKPCWPTSSNPTSRPPTRPAPASACPHFGQVLAQANDTQARLLEAWQLAIWRKLHAELGELIRKNDHRYQGEPVGAEADSWLRAIAAVVGPSTTCRLAGSSPD